MPPPSFTRKTEVLPVILFLLWSAPVSSWSEERPVVIDKNEVFTCPNDSRLKQRMLEEVNKARARARTCGEEQMAPAPAVGWNRKLAFTAARQSAEMAAKDFLGHTGPGGKDLGARVAAAGYAWAAIGENIAGGRSRVAEVVAGWLESPEHCANIMNDRFEEIGAACARNPETTYGTYWVLVLGAQRTTPFGKPRR